MSTPKTKPISSSHCPQFISSSRIDRKAVSRLLKITELAKQAGYRLKEKNS